MFNKKYKMLKNEIEKLDECLYTQINLYMNRADTKYHRGIIDALISTRELIQDILNKGE